MLYRTNDIAASTLGVLAMTFLNRFLDKLPPSHKAPEGRQEIIILKIKMQIYREQNSLWTQAKSIPGTFTSYIPTDFQFLHITHAFNSRQSHFKSPGRFGWGRYNKMEIDKAQQPELILVDQLSKEELARVVIELIRTNQEVRMAIINLACTSPYIKTQV